VVGSPEFKARCLELVDRVKEARAEYVVTRHGTPVAQLVPIEAVQPTSLLGALAGSVQRYTDPFRPVPAVWDLEAPAGSRDRRGRAAAQIARHQGVDRHRTTSPGAARPRP
jgi:prevent-host-death family protein